MILIDFHVTIERRAGSVHVGLFASLDQYGSERITRGN